VASFIIRLFVVAATIAAGACSAPPSSPREFPVKGQIIAIDRERKQITVKHEDIPGYMPGMVMPFNVADPAEIGRRAPGEMITATLVVRELESHLTNIVVTGRAPVDPATARAATTPVLDVGDPVPEGAFQDEGGRARSLSDWRGKAVLMTFIYTRCPVPEFCPRMERNFLTVQSALAANPGLRDRTHLVAVSFDPTYDTPAVLRARAQAIGADAAHWTYLTGELDAIEKFAAQFGVTIVRNEADERDITHNLRTAVIGPDGRIREIFSGNEWQPAEAVAALTEAAGAR